MALIEHGDMPKTMFGIQGFNPWNVLFGGILLAWAFNRQREGLMWDMPRHISVLLLMYLSVILIGVLRAAVDRSYIEDYPLISDKLINTVKWVLPGVLLFDGCRTRRRLLFALVSLLAMYFLISVLVVKSMPFEAAFGDVEIMHFSRQKLDSRVGYNACDISTFLAGASWGILATLTLVRKNKYRVLVLAAAATTAFGQALTGGRAGYLAWSAIGLTLCLMKWRKYLILAPVIVMLLPIALPSVVDRMFEGFGQKNVAGEKVIDDQAVSSGRRLIWPYVLDKIRESPMVGYGQLAMKRTGLANRLMVELNASFPHPHNMYLETLLDNGVLGSVPILLFWAVVLVYAGRMFRSNNRLCAAVGGVTLSLMLAQLFGGIGAQHFYPRESTLGMWAAIFMSLRVYVERARAREVTAVTEGTWNSQTLAQPATRYGTTV